MVGEGNGGAPLVVKTKCPLEKKSGLERGTFFFQIRRVHEVAHESVASPAAMSNNPTNPTAPAPRIVGASPVEQAAQFARHAGEIIRDLKSARASMESLNLLFASHGSMLSATDQETFKSNAKSLNEAATKQEMFLDNVVACLEKEAAKASSSHGTATTECAHVQIALNSILGANELFRAQMTAYAEMATRFVRDNHCTVPVRLETAVSPSSPSPSPVSEVVESQSAPVADVPSDPPTWNDWYDEACKNRALATLVAGSGKAAAVNEMLKQQKHRFSDVWVLTSSGVAKERRRLLPFFEENEVSVFDFSPEALEVLVVRAESMATNGKPSQQTAIVIRMPDAFMRISAERRVYKLFVRALDAGIALFVTVSQTPVFSSVTTTIFDSVGLTASANALVREAAFESFFDRNFTKDEFIHAHFFDTPVNGCIFVCDHPKNKTTDIRMWHPTSVRLVATRESSASSSAQ